MEPALDLMPVPRDRIFASNQRGILWGRA